MGTEEQVQSSYHWLLGVDTDIMSGNVAGPYPGALSPHQLHCILDANETGKEGGQSLRRPLVCVRVCVLFTDFGVQTSP